jgi:predicted DCC family thiol-disulfide oxidoreductase YuxK
MGSQDTPRAVVLFDGVCNLCNGFVQFVIPRDPLGHVRFAALQSEAARRVMAEAGVAPGGADSIVLVEGQRAFVRSGAALRIARLLRFPWPLLYGLVVIPRPIRDWVYDIVARNRFRWFGRRDVCMMPGPETQDRFLV